MFIAIQIYRVFKLSNDTDDSKYPCVESGNTDISDTVFLLVLLNGLEGVGKWTVC